MSDSHDHRSGAGSGAAGSGSAGSGNAGSGSAGSGSSGDEARDLQREMESHLEMLEEDARRSQRGSTDAGAATRAAEARFGDAVEHFREGLAQLERRQRALQRIAGAVALVALLVAAGAVVFNALLLESTRELMRDWSTRATPVEPDWGTWKFDAVLLEFRVETPNGVVRTDTRLSLYEWDEVCASLRSGVSTDSERASGDHVVRCSPGSWPVIRLDALPSEIALDQSPTVSPGTAIVCTPLRQFEARSTVGLGLRSSALVDALKAGTVVDCVPAGWTSTRSPQPR